MMNFGSDNQSGISPVVLDAIIAANNGFAHGYGEDAWTQKARDMLKIVFENDLEAYFVLTGTAANSLAVSCLVNPWQTIITHAQSHIAIDESTAPEFFSGGARIITLGKQSGKLSADQLSRHLSATPQDIPHNASHGAVSITMPNENGLVYTPEEIAEISKLSHANGMFVHMDGARFGNAVASLQCAPARITWQAGVDVLCLGATKNGCLAAEAVIFFNQRAAQSFAQRRKRAGQLLSKGRFLGAQFSAWLQNGHWLTLAQQANRQALKLSQRLSQINGFMIVWPTQANEVFVILPKPTAVRLRDAGADFYEWYHESLPESFTIQPDQIFVRLVASFTTTDQEIDRFCEIASQTI